MEEKQRRPRFGSRRSDRLLIAVTIISVLVLAGGIYGVLQAGGSSDKPAIIPFRLSFEASTGKAGQIQQVNLDGSIDGLTDGNSLDQDPSWSPDGRHMAFTRNGAVYIRDGNGTRALVDSTTASSPQWSPDGTQIAYSDQTPNTATEGFIWIIDANAANKHLVFDPNTGHPPPTNCFGGFVASWYPGGDRILYRGNYPDGSLAVCSVKTDGTDVQTLVHDPAGKALNYSPALSPDGTLLAFVSNRDGNSLIYIANADGTNPIALFTDTGNEDSPAWSPDGQWLAFSSNIAGAMQVYAGHSDGTGVTRLTTDAQDINPAWVPNEK
ncbi:MAG: hypothetical protein ABI559_02445 [Chloroflexota bacterium]